MTTNSRRKGNAYELAVHKWGEAVFGTDRWTRCNRGGFSGDDFDIDGRISIEAKNHARLELAAWLTQADAQAGPDRIPVVIHKRRGTTTVADHYVTLTARDFAALLNGYLT